MSVFNGICLTTRDCKLTCKNPIVAAWIKVIATAVGGFCCELGVERQSRRQLGDLFRKVSDHEIERLPLGLTDHGIQSEKASFDASHSAISRVLHSEFKRESFSLARESSDQEAVFPGPSDMGSSRSSAQYSVVRFYPLAGIVGVAAVSPGFHGGSEDVADVSSF